MLHFKDKSESYKHFYAKYIVSYWLKEYYLSVRIEQFLSMPFEIRIPDVSCYNDNGICAIYEVVKNNPLSNEKKDFYLRYMVYLDLRFKVYEISADYVLNQINKPDKLIVNRIL